MCSDASKIDFIGKFNTAIANKKSLCYNIYISKKIIPVIFMYTEVNMKTKKLAAALIVCILASVLSLTVNAIGDSFSAVSAGIDTSIIIIQNDDSLWAWGAKSDGQVDISPVKIMDGVSQVSMGNNRTAVLKNDSTLWVYELQDYSQAAKIMDDVIQVSSGSDHIAAIKNDGSLWTWGWNFFGQLGDGTKEDKYNEPVKIMDDVFCVSAGPKTTYAIKNDGSLWAWGENQYGQIGDGTVNYPYDEKNERLSPVKIMDNVIQVSGGIYFAVAIKSDGSLWGWGVNSGGQLGDSGGNLIAKPVKVMDDVFQVSSGGNHLMAIKSDGSLWASGSNYMGQLGDGSNSGESRTVPAKIMDDAANVSSGSTHTIAVKTDGSVWIWGNNEAGQLDGSGRTNILSPVKIMDDAKLSQFPVLIIPEKYSPNTGDSLILSFAGIISALILLRKTRYR